MYVIFLDCYVVEEDANLCALIVLKTKFMDVCRHYSKEHRGLHVYFTSVIVSVPIFLESYHYTDLT